MQMSGENATGLMFALRRIEWLFVTCRTLNKRKWLIERVDLHGRRVIRAVELGRKGRGRG